MEKDRENSGREGPTDGLDSKFFSSLPDTSVHIESTQSLSLLGTRHLPSEEANGRKEDRPVNRFPQQLRLHPALQEIGWTDIDEINEAAHRKFHLLSDPVLITTKGIILSGVGTWRLALSEHRHQISCVEYEINDDESLQYILAIHRTRRKWNSFVLIRLALTLEPYFRQKALDNMRIGGKCKGSTNLSKADRIEVRREIAKAAGTGSGNVDKVKAILRSAHPNIIAALQNGSLRIDPAWRWCRLSKCEQKEEFAIYEEEQTRRKVLREFGDGQSRLSFDSRQVLEALQLFDTSHPGQIIVRRSMRRETVVNVGKDLIERIKAQGGC
ncbi:MAG: hypothetical protein JWQ87_522 [Candidatus Sulfotelmatobacter sp.]|nr:hypothetical protein [Candidatus Sulfotelmatobacter sp.]